MAVLAVIAVLAAVATPGFVEMIRERRTQHETAMISDAFRTARARALGRGAAVRVILQEDPPAALVEELISNDASQLPLAGCRMVGTWHRVGEVQGRPGSSVLSAFPPGAGAPVASVATCYTPRGRTYISQDGGVSFQILNGVLELKVRRADGLYQDAAGARSVFVMSNGQTRVAL